MAKLVRPPPPPPLSCLLIVKYCITLTRLQFAKHMKVDEQVAFLKNTKTGIGVGTPSRLIELIENGRL